MGFYENIFLKDDFEGNTEKIKSQRVDINVLKSKLQETEAKEFKKNLTILSALIFVLGFMGIYLSL